MTNVSSIRHSYILVTEKTEETEGNYSTPQSGKVEKTYKRNKPHFRGYFRLRVHFFVFEEIVRQIVY